jgi:hypothetical protein
MRFFKDARGLTFEAESYNADAASAFKSLLDSTAVPYVTGSMPNGGSYFRVEPKDTVRIQTLIRTWATSFDDMRSSMEYSV